MAAPGNLCQAACAGSVLAEEVLDSGVEGDGDLVEARDRGARLGSLDLGKERDAEAGAPAHLLQGQLLLLAAGADRVSDDLLELLLRGPRQPPLSHPPGEHPPELLHAERLL